MKKAGSGCGRSS